MRRIAGSLVASFAGSTVGYVVNQVVGQRSQGRRPDARDIVVGAPLVSAALGGLIGLLGGRHHRLLAFVVGAGIATFFGDLDTMLRAGPRSPQTPGDPPQAA